MNSKYWLAMTAPAAWAALLLGCADVVPTTPTEQQLTPQAAVAASREPSFSAEPASTHVTLRAGDAGGLDSTTIRIAGLGPNGNALRWRAGSSKPWTKLTVRTGRGSARVRWERLTSTLRPGLYLDTIVVTAGRRKALFVDSLTIVHRGTPSAKRLVVSPASLWSSAVQGDPGLQPATARISIGGGSATWSASNRRTWNALKTLTGKGDSALAWVRNPAGLAVGTYVDTITVTSPGSPSAMILDSLRILPKVGGGDVVTGGAESPTGRRPRLVWTPRRQAIWNRMRLERHPWWGLIESNAKRTGTGAVYGDRGQWATLAYQITGDVAYARKAHEEVKRNFLHSGPNDVRQNFAEMVLMYDWLYPALTPADRAEFIGAMNVWAKYALAIGTPTYVGGFRAGDSDATVGYYFGLAFLDLATSDDKTLATHWLSSKSDGTFPIGGLTATGADRRTARNAIAAYAALAEGGEWIESAEYNNNTVMLLLLGAEGVRTATGVDNFPEISRFTKQLAVASQYMVTPDLKAAIQWGDEEHPREFSSRLFGRSTVLTMAGALAAGTSEGQVAKGMLDALAARYGWVGYATTQPLAPALYLADPYATGVDWRGLPAAHLAPGVGLLKVKQRGDLFVAHAGNRLDVDHEILAMGSFQLYRNGEWVITHPLGYAGDAARAPGQNTMLIGGLDVMARREIVASAAGPDWGTISMRTWGSYYDADYWSPPPAFVENWTRSIAYFPEGDASVVVVWDSVVATDPRKLPDLSRYRTVDRDRIMAASDLLQWIVHTPVKPSMTSDRIQWSTPGGQSVILYTLSPGSQKRQLIDERSLWPTEEFVSTREKKYQVRLSPVAAGKSTTFVNVFVVGSTTLAPTITAGGIAIGRTKIAFGRTGVSVTR